MVRHYKRRTDRALIPEDTLRLAVEAVLQEKVSIRQAASRYGLKPGAVFRRVRRVKANKQVSDSGDESGNDSRGRYKQRQVFTNEQELALREHMMNFSKMECGLTSKVAMSIAYEYAVSLRVNHPASWVKKGQAGRDWLVRFAGKHNLPLRKSENANEVMGECSIKTDENLKLEEPGIDMIAPQEEVGQSQKTQEERVSDVEPEKLMEFCMVVTDHGNNAPPAGIRVSRRKDRTSPQGERDVWRCWDCSKSWLKSIL